MDFPPVNEIVGYLNKFAQPALAYDWDNVGFQIGDANHSVKKILLTLDVTENAIDKALAENCDLIISHHPFIFRPLKKITNPLYLKLIKNDIAVYCAHTNLDLVQGGVNTILAEKLGLQNCRFISQDTASKSIQMAVYVPENAANQVAEAILKAGAGKIGNYSDCLNTLPVDGQFRPLAESKPYLGTPHKLEKVKEIKLEFFVESINLPNTIKAMQRSHPYETPVYALYPQKQSKNFGLGLIGDLAAPEMMSDFAQRVKRELAAPTLNLWPAKYSTAKQISRVAVCGGSGSSLLPKLTGQADIFVSADFTYHTILESKLPLIDAGHFYTEYPVLQVLENLLKKFDCEIIRLTPAEHEISHLQQI